MSKKPSIAFTMIGHNEALNLPRALESVSWADEVIYVDCGSTDDSMAVAKKFTDKVFSQPNNPNLNINKTHGINQAKADWIFYLDPDETIPDDLAAEIRNAIADDPPCNAFKLPRRNYFYGAWVRHGGQYPDTQLRLFRRGKAWFACKHVHERLEVEGEVGSLKAAMNHYTNRTPLDSLKKLEFYSSFNAKVLLEQGRHPGWRMGLRYLFWLPFSRFIRRYLIKRGFLDGWAGLFVVLMDSLENQMRFIKYWTLVHFAETRPPETQQPETQASKASAPGAKVSKPQPGKPGEKKCGSGVKGKPARGG